MTIKLNIFLKKLTTTALIGAASLYTFNAQADTLRMGMVTPPSHIWNKVSERFKDNMAEATEGSTRVRIFPLGKLGGEQQMIDLLQSGGIQMAVLTAGALSNREDSISAWFIPGMFDNVEDAAIATQSIEAENMLNKLEKHKLIGLGYTLAGMRHVLSLSTMDSLDSFTNKKIRSFPNKVFNDWWNALDAAPTAMPLSEVTPALNTNLLDAVDVDLDVVVGMKMYQNAPYLTLTNHMAFPGIVVASKPWWDNLTESEQKRVMSSFKDAEKWGFKQQAAAEITNLEKLKKAGVNVVNFDTSSLKPVMEKIVQKYTQSNSSIKAFYEENKQ